MLGTSLQGYLFNTVQSGVPEHTAGRWGEERGEGKRREKEERGRGEGKRRGEEERGIGERKRGGEEERGRGEGKRRGE